MNSVNTKYCVGQNIIVELKIERALLKEILLRALIEKISLNEMFSLLLRRGM